MRIAILKQVVFETSFALGIVLVTAYILWISLKTGLAFGKWKGQVCDKRQSPISYWLCVAVYTFCFICSLFLLFITIKADIIAANWPTPPK